MSARPRNVVVEHVEHFRWRVLQAAFNDALAYYWRGRAERFEAARPRPGDYTGRATPEQIAETDRRIAAQAEACRRHAGIAVANELAEDLRNLRAERRVA